jgi:hypothetical protein
MEAGAGNGKMHQINSGTPGKGGISLHNSAWRVMVKKFTAG